jgi:DNA polymerase-3 subunit beta
MQFVIPKQIFEQAVFRADKVTGKNLSLAVLHAVLLVAEKDTLTLRATNLDLGIEINLPARVSSPGTVAVPGDILSSFLTNTPQTKDVQLSSTKGTLKIISGRNTANLKTLPYDDFPTLPEPNTKKTITLPAKELALGLRSVWYAASPSNMKPELSSVSVSEENGDIVFAATDSFRLAEKRVRVKGADELPPLLVPIKNAHEIVRTLEQAEGQVKLHPGENQLSFVADGTRLTTRTIDSTFPDYKQIVPKEFVTTATVLKEDFTTTLKVSTIFSNKFNQVVFNVSPKKKQFMVETSNPELGESASMLDAALSGEDISIGFNYKYITDSFQSLTTDSVIIKLAGTGKPMVLQGVGDKTFTYLVMPMNR